MLSPSTDICNQRIYIFQSEKLENILLVLLLLLVLNIFDCSCEQLFDAVDLRSSVHRFAEKVAGDLRLAFAYTHQHTKYTPEQDSPLRESLLCLLPTSRNPLNVQDVTIRGLDRVVLDGVALQCDPFQEIHQVACEERSEYAVTLFRPHLK